MPVRYYAGTLTIPATVPDNSPNRDSLIACAECRQPHYQVAVAPGRAARCTRCGTTLYANTLDHRPLGIALTLSSLILFTVALLYPFISITLRGSEREISLVSGIQELFAADMPGLGLLLLVLIVIVPVGVMLALLYVLLRLGSGRMTPLTARALRAILLLGPWSMVEVYLIGAIVALVKIGQMAEIGFGQSFWAYAALTITWAWAAGTINPGSLWMHMPPAPPSGPPALACTVCGALGATRPTGRGRARCTRCSARIRSDRVRSLHTTWALLVTGMILYIPANVYPIMRTDYLGGTLDSTIIGGVLFLWNEGAYPVAIVILVASVMVPVFKFLALGYLLVSVQRGSPRRPHRRTRLYQAVEFIGRWSMIDPFVVAILAALVHMGALATISPGPAVIPFAAVVVVTMLASHTFDPRLIWDGAQARV